jgi:lipopolysaccharide transport system permease protein
MKRVDRIRDAYFGPDHITVIEPPKGWHMFDLRELWAYRELLRALTVRDIKVRYKQTVLGIAWAIIQPVVTMIVFTIVFGKLAKLPTDGFPYPIFVYSALLPWMFFANAIGTAGGSLIGSSHLVSKVYFPRLIIPLSSIGSGLIDLAISTAILLLLMLYYGVSLTMHIFAAPVLLIAVIFTALGVGTLLSALTVAYRDFRFVVPFMIQIWLFCTPVVYAVSLVPEHWQWILGLNPMTGIVEGFRAAFLGKPFNLTSLMISFSISTLIFVVGIAYFEKVERRFADII